MKNKANKSLTGSKIIIKTKDGTEVKGTGIKEDNNYIILKLNNGYNIGILKREIEQIEVLEEEGNKKIKDEKEEATTNEGSNNKNKITISIIHTGGTIASRVDYETGAVVAKFKPKDIIEMFPELKEIANIKSTLLGNFLSENMRIEHYNKMAEAVKKELDSGSEGVIITHGTDTMHYTSAALSFILEGLDKPVVLVGAQRSSDRASSDAYLNLINAAYFIKETKEPGVFICMHKSMNDDESIIIPGTKARKMHTSRRDAFKPINTKAVAEVSYEKKNIKIVKRNEEETKGKKLELKKINPNIKVGLLKSYPGITHNQFEFFKDYDGLVVEGTGLGHLPIIKNDELSEENERIYKALKDMAKKTLIVMSSQTIYGRVNMNVYSPGRKLLEIGVLGNYSDMTPETTLIKLWWLLSNYTKEDIVKNNLVTKNFRGEITKRSDENFETPLN